MTLRCECHFEMLLGRSYDVPPKLKEYAITNLLVFNTHIWYIKTENSTTEINFVHMFKIGTFIGHLWDVSIKIGNYKTTNSLMLQAYTS